MLRFFVRVGIVFISEYLAATFTTQAGTRSRSKAVSRSSPTPLAGGGGGFVGGLTTMKKNSNSRDIASSRAKLPEECWSTPRRRPCGPTGAFPVLRKARRAGPDGPSLWIRVGLVTKLQRGLGYILSACCRLSFRVSHSLLDLEEWVWSTWAEPIESERRLRSLDGSSRLPSSQVRFAFMRDLPGMEGPQEVPVDIAVIDPFTGEPESSFEPASRHTSGGPTGTR